MRWFGSRYRFLKMVNFEDTRPYMFNTENDVHKPAMATGLVEKFAEYLAIKRRGLVDTELRLGRGGSSRS